MAPSFDMVRLFFVRERVIFLSPYLVALSNKMSITCRKSCLGRRRVIGLVSCFKVILPVNLGWNISMRFWSSVDKLIISGGFVFAEPASILASCRRSNTNLLA